MSQNRPLSYSSRKRRTAVSAAILLFCAAFSLLGGRGPAVAAAQKQAGSSSCASAAAIPDPEPAGLMADCETLLGLKDELAGDAALNWNTSLPISDWEGVTVENDRVAVLDLFDKGLTGRIPVELANLTNLKKLNLFINQLTGTIPAELGNLTNLEALSLGSNQLTGTIPAELGNLTNLESLFLSGTLLIGNIPVELETLTNLQQLYLNNNQLTGTIPAELSKLTDLRQLSFFSNQLTGVIPIELESLTNLRYLHLSSNQLAGTIPVELGNLTNLVELSLSSNQLTGTIPAELGNLTNLSNLDLSSNDLTGTIPTELDNLVPPTGKLYSVRIATGNPGLCGPIPPALHALSPTHPNDVNDLGSDTYPTGNLRSCSSAPLAAPELTVQASAGAVELSWEAVQDAVRYELLDWWDAETGWQPLDGDNLTGTSYTHTTVTPRTKYYYSIRTVTAAGQTSDWLKPYPSATVLVAGPPPPKSAPIAAAVTPTRTPVPALPNDGRCSFAGTEPRVPDPVGLAVYDCDAWSLAYALVILDRPEFMFADVDNEVRIDVTHIVFTSLRQAALNCSTDIYQIAGIVTVAGDMIESHGNPKDSDLLAAPRISTVGGLESARGTVDECRAVAMAWLDDQLN